MLCQQSSFGTGESRSSLLTAKFLTREGSRLIPTPFENGIEASGLFVYSSRYVQEPDLGGKKSQFYTRFGSFLLLVSNNIGTDFCSIVPNLVDFLSERFQIW